MAQAILLVSLCSIAATPARTEPAPVRFGIVGLVHDHARGFILGVSARQDIQLVGIAEPNAELAQRYARDYKLSTNLFYPRLEEMLDKAHPQAVGVFTSTFEHRRVVETCAARGIHVMMEKPLAVSMEHAHAIEAAAKQGGIQVVVNYETTWYPANQAAFDLIHQQKAIGDLRKIVVHDGHQGPKEIGCSAAFLEWLTDPVLNGGGALTDFGCYGADLITWLMDGQRPASVFAVKEFVLQLDVGTCEEVGADPVAWVKANPGRIKVMHLKDWAPGSRTEEKGYRVLFGEGVTPWKELLAAAEWRRVKTLASHREGTNRLP